MRSVMWSGVGVPHTAARYRALVRDSESTWTVVESKQSAG